MKQNEEEQLNRSPNKKLRAEILRQIKQDEIQGNNDSLYKRVNSKNSFVDFGMLEDRYNKHQYYMKFNKKFELPKIEHAGKYIGNVSTLGFMRKNNPHDSCISQDCYFDPNTKESTFNMRSSNISTLTKHKNLNISDDNISQEGEIKEPVIYRKRLGNSNSVLGLYDKSKNYSKNYSQFSENPFEKNEQYKPFEKLKIA